MRRTLRLVGAAGLLAATLGLTSTATAQPPPLRAGESKIDRTRAAEELFQRGKALLTKGEVSAACPLLLESYQLEPAGGTLQNLAICYEDLGNWASAYARFQELRALSSSSHPPRLDRVRLADEHMTVIAPRLSRVVIAMPDSNTGAKVALDGVEQLEASWSSGIDIDPGSHEVVVSARGKNSYRVTVTASPYGGRQEIVIPVLTEVGSARRSESSLAAAETRPLASGSKWDRTGVILGAVGLAALAAGATFGVLTFARNQEGRDLCSADKNPSARRDDFDPAGRCYEHTSTAIAANDAKDDARLFANMANVLLPVGLIAAGVGLALVVRGRAPPTTSALPQLFVRSASRVVSLGGAF